MGRCSFAKPAMYLTTDSAALAPFCFSREGDLIARDRVSLMKFFSSSSSTPSFHSLTLSARIFSMASSPRVLRCSPIATSLT